MRAIVFLFLISLSVFAGQDWIIEEKNGHFFLKNGNEKYAIVTETGIPKFVTDKKLNKNFSAVVYKAGEVGTQKIMVIERALLFKKGKFLEDVPYKYYEKGSSESSGPDWKITKDSITIKDSTDNRTWKF